MVFAAGEKKLEDWKRAEKVAQVVTFEPDLLSKFGEFYSRVCQWVLMVQFTIYTSRDYMYSNT